MTRLTAEALEERAAENHVSGLRRQELRVSDPGIEPLAHDVGAPDQGMPALVPFEPAPEQPARLLGRGLARDRGDIGEPGETVQLRLPIGIG